MNGNIPKQLLTAKEVSATLNIGLSTVYAYADLGVLKALYLPPLKRSIATKRNKRAMRFRLETINAFIHDIERDGFGDEEVR